MPGEIPPMFTLSFEQTRPMQRPLVYVRRRVSDGKAIYIGSSLDGLSRPLGKANEKAHLAEGEILEVYLTDYPRELEARLILQERPLLNGDGPNSRYKSTGHCAVCGKPLSRGGAVFCGELCQKAAREAPRENRALRQRVWDLERQNGARAPVERALTTLLARVEEAVQEAREGLAETVRPGGSILVPDERDTLPDGISRNLSSHGGREER